MNDDRPLIYYQLTAPTLTDGQQARGLRVSNRNELLVAQSIGGVALLALADNADAVAASATVNGEKVVARNTVFNGTTWDRMRGDANGAVFQAAPSATHWAYAAVAGGIVNSVADVVIKAAAGAGVRNVLGTLHIAHDVLGAATEIVVKDGATVIWRGRLQTPAGGSSAIVFNPPLRGTADTALNVACVTAVTGGIYINAQGFTAT